MIRELSDEEILYCSSDRSGKLFLKLNSLITLDLGNGVTCTLLNKQELEPVFAHMNRFGNLYTVRLETEYANEILASQSPWDVLGISLLQELPQAGPYRIRRFRAKSRGQGFFSSGAGLSL